MGFYGPAQLVRDAREHGVQIRSACVNASRWDCTLEPAVGRTLAIRLGLRMAKGRSNDDGAPRIIAHRASTPYGGVEELWRRAGVPAAALEKLAEADAYHSLGLDRRQALWAIRGLADAWQASMAAMLITARRVESLTSGAALISGLVRRILAAAPILFFRFGCSSVGP